VIRWSYKVTFVEEVLDSVQAGVAPSQPAPGPAVLRVVQESIVGTEDDLAANPKLLPFPLALLVEQLLHLRLVFSLLEECGIWYRWTAWFESKEPQSILKFPALEFHNKGDLVAVDAALETVEASILIE
jgi:hypothetical protein